MSTAREEPKLDTRAYDEFRRHLETVTGIELGDGKQYLVSSRLAPVLKARALPDLSALVVALQAPGSGALRQQVVDAMTTGETQWFRDVHPFEVLHKVLLPKFVAQQIPRVRVWSAACSTGQEPYSISMKVSEFADTTARAPVVEIVGTDISSRALEHAGRGRYGALCMERGMNESRRRRFFTQQGQYWDVCPEIQQRVRFTPVNLLQDFGMLGKFHIIFCRNVLIYFSSKKKQEILERMARSLHPNGYLFLGATESMSGYADWFELERFDTGVAYRLK